MALGTRRAQPNMSYAALCNLINENFDLLENINRTQIIKDDTGTPRILIGRLPDGTYGLVVSKPGTDVLGLFD